MANAQQIGAFIEKIGPCAKVGYQTIGKILPSVCIGMGCVESAYGTAGSCKYHSYFGQKVGTGKTATKYWDGKSFNSRTKEEYTVGTHTVITDAFRAYDSMQQCVLNFYELLNTRLYSRVLPGVDFSTQMQQIKACGYMTSSTEVNTVIALIKRYGLTAYDAADWKEASPVPPRILKKGDSGQDVRWLQNALNMNGAGLAVDGVFGGKTHIAVLAFQAVNGLTADGIVGPATRAKLLGQV